MFTVTVRDRLMIAHSMTGAGFGPAQRLHGATYLVEASFRGDRLDGDGVLVDIGRAAGLLREILAELDYRNLDEVPAFSGRNSTTEVVAQDVADRLATRIRDGALGDAASGLTGLVVTLRESDVAWASYERAP